MAQIWGRSYGERGNGFCSSFEKCAEPAWRREDALLCARFLHYRGDRRIAGIWRDRFGRRGSREDFVFRFPGALYRDPDRPCLAWQDRLGVRERVPDPTHLYPNSTVIPKDGDARRPSAP